MSSSNPNLTVDPTEVFADPVAYLASFDIDAELVSGDEGCLPIAA